MKKLVAAIVSLLLASCASAPTREAEVTTLVARMLDERRIPSAAVVVMRRGKVLYAKGFGDATPETLFQWGSVGKQFTAAGVLRLAERGLVRLDAPVAQYLPEIPWRNVQVGHLLHQTSGIREFFTIPEFNQQAGDLHRPVGELIAMFVREPLGFEPGSRWSYSNSNYTLLASLIERVTDKPYEVFLRDEFFAPMGLASIHHCPSVATSDRYAVGHVLRSGELRRSEPENMNWARGDGGLCGSAMDLARWTDARRPAAIPDMAPPRYASALSYVPLDGTVARVGHNGAMLGFSTSAAHYPDHGLSVAVVTNRGGIFADAIEKAVARRFLGLPSPAATDVAMSAEELSTIAGEFDIGVHDFPLRLENRDGAIWLVMKRPAPTHRLRYVGDGELVSVEEPDGVRVKLDAARNRAVLYMGGMEWYGVRSSRGTSAPDR